MSKNQADTSNETLVDIVYNEAIGNIVTKKRTRKAKVKTEPPPAPPSSPEPTSEDSKEEIKSPEEGKRSRGRPKSVSDWNVYKKEYNDKYNNQLKIKRASTRLKDTKNLLIELGVSKERILATIME